MHILLRGIPYTVKNRSFSKNRQKKQKVKKKRVQNKAYGMPHTGGIYYGKNIIFSAPTDTIRAPISSIMEDKPTISVSSVENMESSQSSLMQSSLPVSDKSDFDISYEDIRKTDIFANGGIYTTINCTYITYI